MKRWNIKIYNAYTQPLLSWFFLEFAGSWGVLAIAVAVTWESFQDGEFGASIIEFLLVILSLILGIFQRSIDIMLFSPSKVWVARDGIYGKSMFARYFLYFAKPQLLAKWEEIDKVVLKMYRFSLNDNTGYAEFFKKDGTKFHISYHGFAPSNVFFFLANEGEILCNRTDRGICTELFGIIAWKIGLSKFENFFQEELKTSQEVRKRTMSCEGFRRVILSIEHGVEGGGRENLPYKKMEEEWLKEVEANV